MAVANRKSRCTTTKITQQFTVLAIKNPQICLFEDRKTDAKAFVCVKLEDQQKFNKVAEGGCVYICDDRVTKVPLESLRSLSRKQNVDFSIVIHGLTQPQTSEELVPCYTHRLDQHRPASGETKKLELCQTNLHSDEHAVVHIGSNEIGISVQSQKLLQARHKFQAKIAAVKEIASLGESKYAIVLTHDGYVHLLEAKRNSDGEYRIVSKFKTKLMQINAATKAKHQIVGLCVEGNESTFAIGTNSNLLFMMRWNRREPSTLKPSAKKELATNGVSSLAMMTGQGMLAMGCFDGKVRLFRFPEIEMLTCISYHKTPTQINTLLFINEKLDKTGRWYLLCGAGDKGLAVWNVEATETND